MTERKAWRTGGLAMVGALVLGGCAVDEPATPGAPAAVEAPKATATPTPETPDPKPAVAPRPGLITEVDLGRLIGLRDAGKVLLVDVRPAMFYRMEHIPGAVSLPKKTFDSSWPGRKSDVDAAVAAGKVVVLYCANEECPDGYAVAKRLSPLGYAVSIYKGGWDEWKMAGFQ